VAFPSRHLVQSCYILEIAQGVVLTGEQMQRRDFITLLGGAAVWPLTARGQQPERMRRIGVIMGFAENDPEGRAQLSGFTQGFQELGWTDGGPGQH
jgi:hypothetical protein